MEKRSMVLVDLQNAHGMTTGAKERVKAKRECDGIAPAIEGTEDFAFAGVNRIAKVRHLGMVFGINPIIADHFKMLAGNMADEPLDQVHGRNGFVDQEAILMAVVMKSDRLTIIGVNPGSGNDRTTEVTADIVGNLMGITDIGFGIDIKPLGTEFINQGFHGREGRTETSSQTIKQSSPEGKAKEVEIEMTDLTPGSLITSRSFRNKDVDMRVPLEIAAKGVKDSDETGREVFRLVHF